MSEVAPTHNPPYIAAMRLLSEKRPSSTRRGFRNGLSPDDPRSQQVLSRALRLGRKVPRQALGDSTARAIVTSLLHGRTAGAKTVPRRFLSLGRLELALRAIRGRTSVRATVRDLVVGRASQQPGRRLRSVCDSRDHEAHGANRCCRCWKTWPNGAPRWGSATRRVFAITAMVNVLMACIENLPFRLAPSGVSTSSLRPARPS